MTFEYPTGFAERTFIPYANTFGENFVQGRVERIDVTRQTVILQGGKVRYKVQSVSFPPVSFPPVSFPRASVFCAKLG